MQEKVAITSFDRIEDPVIDQDNAKIIGALGGGYGAWKHHAGSVAGRKGLLDRAMGRIASPLTRPTRALVGAGLGALAAGTLARYLNKENKEDHEEQLANSYAQAANPYQGGMYNYASEKTASFEFAPMSMGQSADKAIQGGLLGALAAAILGKSPKSGAMIGSLGNVAANSYKHVPDQEEARSESYDNYADHYFDNQEKNAMDKEARLGDSLITSQLKKAAKAVANKGTEAVKKVDYKKGYKNALDYALKTGK